jgi:hypothetical protein
MQRREANDIPSHETVAQPVPLRKTFVQPTAPTRPPDIQPPPPPPRPRD